MKRLLLTELLMISLADKKARRVPFDPQVTVIRGANNVGKSSLIKTIYRTLGAELSGITEKWEQSAVRSVVSFTVDGVPYRVLRDGSRFTVFDGKSKKLESFGSVTKGLAPYFAQLFNFNLQLATHGKETQATPAFLFLPFYVDQDRSWTDTWDGFDRLQQFSNWKRDVAEFHTGIKPGEYYVAKTDHAKAQRELAEEQRKRAVLYEVVKRLERKLKLARFDIDINAYQAEIAELLQRCNELRDKEDEFKRDMVALHNSRSAVEAQVAITLAAARELSKDYQHANDQLEDDVECPTCGQHYHNTFAARFSIAQDEDECRNLVLKLQHERDGFDAKLKTLRTTVEQLTQERVGYQRLLDEKQGEVKLRDLIENEGKKEVRQVMRAEIDQLNLEIGRIDERMQKAKSRMEDYTDKEHKAEILADYEKLFRRFLNTLAVFNLHEKVFRRVDPKISESGSDVPRAYLAYYFAILHTINARSTSTFCPIIIDSPKQQDQDATNWTKIVNFLKDNRPENAQLILGCVDQASVRFPGSTVELKRKYSVLVEEQFEDVAKEMRPMLDASVGD